MAAVTEDRPYQSSSLAQGLLVLEIVLLSFIGLLFWFPLGGQIIDRADWVWLPLVFFPLEAARLLLGGRRFPVTALTLLGGLLLLLGVINVICAPFTWGLGTLARPLFGVLLVYSMVQIALTSGRMVGLLRVVVLFALGLGLVALLLTQWNEKSGALEFVTSALPSLRYPPDAEGLLPQAVRVLFGGGFNANEIAGALAWLTPLVAALTIYAWREKLPRSGVTVAFCLLFLALMLGQSRMAIIGVLLALAVNIALLIPRGKWRRWAWVALALVSLLELALIFNPAERDRLEERDENSLAGRLAMWNSGLAILTDYPLIGVGMNQYRTSAVRTLYPVPGYESRILPHIHNEALQVAVDMGIPGLVLFLGLYAAAGRMIYQTWREGLTSARAVSAAVGTGLLAHGIYGLADAITLWDRFAPLFWIMLGLVAAQYSLVRLYKNMRSA